MLARLQQFITIGLLAAAVGWLAAWFTLGHPWWALAAAALTVFGHAVVLALEFTMMAAVHGRDPAPRATLRQLLRAWLDESIAAPQVFCWRQPFLSQREPDCLTGDPARRGVVFVHGFVCNRGFWNPWLERLRRERRSFCAADLEPVFGAIDDYPRAIDAAVQRVRLATGRAPVLVAHSMGGLAVRAWLAEPGRAAQVHRVVTIGSPHQGTWLARFAHTPNGRDMQVEGVWLQALRDRDGALAAHERLPASRFTCFYSHCDNIVFPASNATLPGADNRHVDGAAHVAMAFDPRVVDATLALLRQSDDERER